MVCTKLTSVDRFETYALALVRSGGRRRRSGAFPKDVRLSGRRTGVIVAHALTEPTVDDATVGIDLIRAAAPCEPCTNALHQRLDESSARVILSGCHLRCGGGRAFREPRVGAPPRRNPPSRGLECRLAA